MSEAAVPESVTTAAVQHVVGVAEAVGAAQQLRAMFAERDDPFAREIR